MKTFLTLAMLLSSLSSFAISKDSTISEIYNSGYILKAKVKREKGIIVGMYSTREKIGEDCAIKLKAKSANKRILATGRTFTLDYSDYSTSLYSSSDSAVQAIDVYVVDLQNQNVKALEVACPGLDFSIEFDESIEQASELDAEQFSNNV